jgi:hypothetical protein
MPERTLYVHFASRKDVEGFANLVGQKIGPKTKYIWFPEAERLPQVVDNAE